LLYVAAGHLVIDRDRLQHRVETFAELYHDQNIAQFRWRDAVGQALAGARAAGVKRVIITNGEAAVRTDQMPCWSRLTTWSPPDTGGLSAANAKIICSRFAHITSRD